MLQPQTYLAAARRLTSALGRWHVRAAREPPCGGQMSRPHHVYMYRVRTRVRSRTGRSPVRASLGRSARRAIVYPSLSGWQDIMIDSH